MANSWQGPFPLQDLGADGHHGRASVGCYAANGFGLYDMVGNVWEWTSDSYRPRHVPPGVPHATAVTRAEDQEGLPPGVRVIKGGSFLCSPDFCLRYRPSARQPQDPSLSTLHIGFRTVLRDS
jgi:formylglycine-generating enzyme required for sulfatase activity